MCTEIPDEEKLPELHKTISTFMTHGSCGLVTWVHHVWKMRNVQKIAKGVFAETYEGDGYPHYKWKNHGKYVMKNGVPLNNKWVVLYNPFLNRKYNAHINVEICRSITSCKYLYQYVDKGPVITSVAVDSQLQNDTYQGYEIHKYMNPWFVTALEACLRIF